MIFDAKKELTLKHSAYKKAVQFYVGGMYKEDAGNGDITTKAFVRKTGQVVTGHIVAKEAGIFAGLIEVQWLLKKLGIKIVKHHKEGKVFKKGDIVMTLVGHANDLLKAERTVLNVLQRLSGIATATDKLASKLPKGIKLLATRKTHWGLLDKRAVTVGGGATHRLNLADAILIKENHLILEEDIEKRLKKAFKMAKKTRFVEIEVESALQAEVIQGYFEKYKDKYKLKDKVMIMLDDFSPAQVKKLAPGLKQSGMLVEVSGGVNAMNIKRYAQKGVSAISSGAITTKALPIDLSMMIIPSK